MTGAPAAVPPRIEVVSAGEHSPRLFIELCVKGRHVELVVPRRRDLAVDGARGSRIIASLLADRLKVDMDGVGPRIAGDQRGVPRISPDSEERVIVGHGERRGYAVFNGPREVGQGRAVWGQVGPRDVKVERDEGQRVRGSEAGYGPAQLDDVADGVELLVRLIEDQRHDLLIDTEGCLHRLEDIGAGCLDRITGDRSPVRDMDLQPDGAVPPGVNAHMVVGEPGVPPAAVKDGVVLPRRGFGEGNVVVREGRPLDREVEVSAALRGRLIENDCGRVVPHREGVWHFAVEVVEGHPEDHRHLGVPGDAALIREPEDEGVVPDCRVCGEVLKRDRVPGNVRDARCFDVALQFILVPRALELAEREVVVGEQELHSHPVGQGILPAGVRYRLDIRPKGAHHHLSETAGNILHQAVSALINRPVAVNRIVLAGTSTDVIRDAAGERDRVGLLPPGIDPDHPDRVPLYRVGERRKVHGPLSLKNGIAGADPGVGSFGCYEPCRSRRSENSQEEERRCEYHHDPISVHISETPWGGDAPHCQIYLLYRYFTLLRCRGALHQRISVLKGMFSKNKAINGVFRKVNAIWKR